MQNAKIIDVTRSFIPVDPNEYPENLHIFSGENSPEQRTPPIVPYMGWNFMPTAYGYRSFFGTNSAGDYASLSPNKPDHVFLFQTLTYKNVWIALCDTGIWIKEASTTGAWTQLVVLAAPADDVFYEWYFFTIQNKLYCYRANGANFYEILTDAGIPTTNIACNTKTPNFITPTAQLGMFRLGQRVGFWDAQNAVAYSSADDYEDFTPAVLTGANVTTFNSVLGKISSIRSHGNNAIIYASKSVVGLVIQAGETFLVRAEPILQAAGVPYARNSVAAATDTVHYAYTTTGIYRIENGKPDQVVPEVWDYFQKMKTGIVYLRYLEGRHLVFEVMDEDTINGNPIFTKEYIDSSSITFPGYDSVDDLHNLPALPYDNVTLMNSLDSGSFGEMQSAFAGTGAQKKPGTFATPIWTCYLSNNGVKDVNNITFGAVPCGFTGPLGTSFKMSPNGVPKTTDLTTDSTHKTASSGSDAWVDGNWTMQRFAQVQTAIWEKEEQVLQDVVNRILAQAYFEQKTTNDVTVCAASGPTTSYCALGTYPYTFTPPQFGFNGCSFWLTRYCTEAKQLRAANINQVQCDNTGTLHSAPSYFKATFNGGDFSGIHHATAADCVTEVASFYGFAGFQYFPDGSDNNPGGPGNLISAQQGEIRDQAFPTSSRPYGIRAYWQADDADHYLQQSGTAFAPNQPVIYQYLIAGHYNKIETGSAHNEVQNSLTGILAVESAYCEITGWKYTKPDGTTATVAAASCTNTTDDYPSSTSTGTRAVPSDDTRPPVASGDGSLGDFPYSIPSITGIDSTDWPDQTLTYPPSSFLLQNGSIAPKYPTFVGAFVYDTELKKWGKAKLNYKQLLDYAPINSESSSLVPYTTFGMLAGAIKDDGFLYIFDDKPASSEITWGKIGFYRLGITDCESIRFDFASVCSGTLRVDVSVEGQEILAPISYSISYDGKQVIGYPPYSAKWFNVTLSGKFDVSYAEFNGLTKGRR